MVVGPAPAVGEGQGVDTCLNPHLMQVVAYTSDEGLWHIIAAEGILVDGIDVILWAAAGHREQQCR